MFESLWRSWAISATSSYFRGPRMGGWIRRGWIWRFSVQRSQTTHFNLWTENRGAPKTPNPTTTDPTPHSQPSDYLCVASVFLVLENHTLGIARNPMGRVDLMGPECTKIARFSAVAAAILLSDREVGVSPRTTSAKSKINIVSAKLGLVRSLAFFLGSDNSHTTPPQKDNLVRKVFCGWGVCVCGRLAAPHTAPRKIARFFYVPKMRDFLAIKNR